MNKRGTVVDYVVLLLIIVMIATVTLYFTVKDKTVAERDIGTMQAQVLKINGDVRLYKAFIGTAAEQALEDSIPVSASRLSANCPVLNSEGNPRNLSLPDIHSVVSRSFNEKMNPLLSGYSEATGLDIPLDNFEVFAKKGKFIGVAVKPTEIVSGNPVAFYRPAFELNYNHGFEQYLSVFSKLQVVASQCSFSADVQGCVKGLADNIAVSSKNQTFSFKMPVGSATVCYKLFIPSQA